MRYISDVLDNRGVSVPAGDVGRNGSCIAHIFDSDTLETSVWTPGDGFDSIDGFDSVAGLSRRMGIAVRHSHINAKLYDYIKRVDMIKSHSEYNADEATILEAMDMWASLDGFKGSVAEYMMLGNMDASVYNLYDFLCMMCKHYGMSLMTKRYLIMSFQIKTLIEFEHTPEADRFFLKMALDAMGR